MRIIILFLSVGISCATVVPPKANIPVINGIKEVQKSGMTCDEKNRFTFNRAAELDKALTACEKEKMLIFTENQDLKSINTVLSRKAGKGDMVDQIMIFAGIILAGYMAIIILKKKFF